MIDVTPGQLGMATPLWELLGSSDAEMHAELQDYVDLGVDWLRLEFNWTHVQSNANTFRWDVIDRVVDAANSYNIEVVAILHGSASFVNSSFSDNYSREKYAAFAAEAARHFGDRVDYWEILNEPNMHGISPENYTKLLQQAYTAIKSVDSSDFVISGGTAAVPYNKNGFWGAPEYLTGMYAAGAAGYMDAVGYHPYTWPLMPSGTQNWNGWHIMETKLREIMVKNGDGDLQIWMTEFGAPTAGSSTAMTGSQIAAMLEEAVQIAQGYDWAGPILYYSYEDRGGATTNTENWYGLRRPDGSTKEAYHTYKRLGNLDNDIDAPAPAPAPDDGGSGGGSAAVYRYTTYPWVTISDFVAGDKIDLSQLDANSLDAGKQSFIFVGSSWVNDPGELGVYTNASQNRTYVQGDLNGDTFIDFNIIIEGIHQLDRNDFILNTTHAFDALTQSAVISNWNDGDVIDLRALDADRTSAGKQSFDFVGGNWLSGPGELGVYVDTKNQLTHVQARTASTIDFRLVIEGMHQLDRDDFVLYTTHDFDELTQSAVISDWSDGDVIDLRALDADRTSAGDQSFDFIGGSWLSGPGDLGVYIDSKNQLTHVQAKTTSDIDFRLVIHGIHVLDEGDFIL